jgi:hypothetical protein
MNFLNHWWNAPYLVLLGLLVAAILIQLLGGFHAHDIEHDLDHDHDHDAHASDLPIITSFSVFALAAGGLGLMVNRVAYALFETPGIAAAAFAPVAVLFGLSMQKIAGRAATKIFGELKPSNTSRGAFVGAVGRVVSRTADQRFGQIAVQSEDGHDVLVHARVADAHTPLSYGAQALIVSYEPADDIFVITAFEIEGKV